MQIGIVCKVIDNYGDAGFSLRLAKALAIKGHSVSLFHDNLPTFEALYPANDVSGLQLIDASRAEFNADAYRLLDLVIEPFGTSSEQTEYRFDLAIKESCPATPWLLVDYLSSEEWVESFHLSQSVDPNTGRITSYFYPGFTDKTGGLIHCDYPQYLRQAKNTAIQNTLKVFVFAYPNAPLLELLQACEELNEQGLAQIEIGVAGKLPRNSKFEYATALPFCPQSQFDGLLAGHDVLFVRGEDSFVRAQLAGKPFVWQIYPTQDLAHAKKLADFFKRYSTGLSAPCSSALWNCWASWNRLEECAGFIESWQGLQVHWTELQAHANRWRNELFAGPELVKEILTWRSGQTPTLMEKPDL
ncbi:elongation factor P maturation arginine rhamnosyltransferase EarP [Limnobacter parvus]|uniref:Protein-arginine rhamnosyltransferase n=1 Tax=Limnobacter parvus TaxID=2939690 RepID=A0ABT1XGL1_9BURK|nr:elongation factor P maturation arginine rhamnosyltransferase EarP [Limnobacter parvus]MCR2746412.1 elongation factor P maturation arginine rhamnosyltransferase EarP [Limnobacter parvus]